MNYRGLERKLRRLKIAGTKIIRFLERCNWDTIRRNVSSFGVEIRYPVSRRERFGSRHPKSRVAAINFASRARTLMRRTEVERCWARGETASGLAARGIK